jgi:spoIIIJ-associated protein
MVYQFEGKTENEAVETAARELGLEKDKFDVEIVEAQKGSLFKKGLVRIEVHTNAEIVKRPESTQNGAKNSVQKNSGEDYLSGKDDIDNTPRERTYDAAFEKDVIDFTSGMIQRMGYDVSVSAAFREGMKLGLKIDSESSSLIIGKKGKNLDALQLLVNNYAAKMGRRDIRVVLDSEDYRLRREEAIVKLAYNVADKVRQNRASLLLEPMNPFERRIVHTTLADIQDIATKSEGEGTYKQVRVSFHGSR